MSPIHGVNTVLVIFNRKTHFRLAKDFSLDDGTLFERFSQIQERRYTIWGSKGGGSEVSFCFVG